MLFLATADEEGRPNCSYKGGDPASCASSTSRRSRSRATTATGCSSRPGNALANPNVGILFISFEERHAAAAERRRFDRPRRSAARRVPEGAQLVVRVAGDRGVPELPALHPPLRAGRALALRPAHRVRDAGAGVEDAGVVEGRAAGGRSRGGAGRRDPLAGVHLPLMRVPAWFGRGQSAHSAPCRALIPGAVLLVAAVAAGVVVLERRHGGTTPHVAAPRTQPCRRGTSSTGHACTSRSSGWGRCPHRSRIRLRRPWDRAGAPPRRADAGGHLVRRHRARRPGGARAAGALPVALHDAAAVRLGRSVYLFGGGDGVRQLDAILRVPLGGGSATPAGRLPAPSLGPGGRRDRRRRPTSSAATRARAGSTRSSPGGRAPRRGSSRTCRRAALRRGHGDRRDGS